MIDAMCDKCNKHTCDTHTTPHVWQAHKRHTYSTHDTHVECTHIKYDMPVWRPHDAFVWHTAHTHTQHTDARVTHMIHTCGRYTTFTRVTHKTYTRVWYTCVTPHMWDTNHVCSAIPPSQTSLVSSYQNQQTGTSIKQSNIVNNNNTTTTTTITKQ